MWRIIKLLTLLLVGLPIMSFAGDDKHVAPTPENGAETYRRILERDKAARRSLEEHRIHEQQRQQQRTGVNPWLFLGPILGFVALLVTLLIRKQAEVNRLKAQANKSSEEAPGKGDSEGESKGNS